MLTRPALVSAPATLLVVVLAAVLAGCTPTPVPVASPTPTESAVESEAPSLTPMPEPLAIPDCADIYSASVVATLTSEGRTSSGDVSSPDMGGWGTYDPSIQAILAAIPERVSCTWILPASESGSTTSIARLDAASRTTLVTAFGAGGFIASTTPDGERYTIEVETEVGSYTETHLLTAEFWIGSVYSGGDSALLTGDATAQLLP